MNKFTLVILLIIVFSYPAKAFKIEDIFDFIEEKIKSYPEQRHKKINIQTGNSPLAAIESVEAKSKRELEKVKQSQERIVTFSAANKIVGLADGIINVKYQVQDGVKNALKDIFIGYPEYQRRKITEEVTNANLNSHLALVRFLYNFDFKNYLLSLLESKQNESIRRFNEIIKNLSFKLLLVISIIKLLELFFIKESAVREERETLAKKLILGIIIFLLLDEIWFLINQFSFFLDESLNKNSFFDYQNINNLSLTSKLINSWENLLSTIGYFPALILSIIDTLNHLFFFSLFGILSLNLIIIKSLSPLLIVSEILSSKLKLSFKYFKVYIKLTVLLCLIPLFIKINSIVSNSIDINGLKYLNMIFSINLFVILNFVIIQTLKYNFKKH